MRDVTLLQIIAMGLPAVGYVAAWWMEPQRRARRVLERARPKRLCDVRDGDRARVVGVVRRLRATLVSPVTGRACVGYRYVIEARGSAVGDWHVVAQRSECAPFQLVDEGVEAQIEGPFLFGLDFDDRGDVWTNLPLGLFRVLEGARVALSGPFGGEKEFRFREAVLRSDDRITVLGDVAIEIDGAGRREALRGPPLARRIRGTPQAPVALADAEEDTAPVVSRG
ncbi:MAG TPA: hypothetical protein VH560_18610 [Polyangia bacterium]|jgi:hypothetical protein|nr:hypothetical protein [Polyangia bacterium]